MEDQTESSYFNSYLMFANILFVNREDNPAESTGNLINNMVFSILVNLSIVFHWV